MPGALLVFLNYLTRLYKPMKELSKQTDIMSRAGAGLERVITILDTEREVQDLDRHGAQLKGIVVRPSSQRA